MTFVRRLVLTTVLSFLTMTMILPAQLFTTSTVQVQQPFAVSFVYSPQFILIGDSVNFTAIVNGGTPPYTISWDFGDGQTGSGQQKFHAFATPATYNVTVTITDSASPILTASSHLLVAVQLWPVPRLGWSIRWNITANDGINVWNVTYKNILVIRDARLPGIQVLYKQDFCGPFYDEAFNEITAKNEGEIFYENSTEQSNPYFQIRAAYESPGYYYQETYRFYPTGKWETELTIARGGCAFDHIYEPHWRFDLATHTNDTRDFMSNYSPTGAWNDLIWEGNYTENGFTDQTQNGAIWRYGDQGRYYYIAQNIVRTDLDLPYLPSNLLLTRGRSYEIERSHPAQGIENPTEWVNGELAFRTNIVFWYVPRIWDHGPVNSAPPKDITLSFYPYGAWP